MREFVQASARRRFDAGRRQGDNRLCLTIV